MRLCKIATSLRPLYTSLEISSRIVNTVYPHPKLRIGKTILVLRAFGARDGSTKPIISIGDKLFECSHELAHIVNSNWEESLL